MKIRAIHSAQVNGYGIVCKGDVVDIDASRIDARICANFVAEDGTRLSFEKKSEEGAQNEAPGDGKTKEEKEYTQTLANCISTLGREGIRRKLDDMGITYSPNAKTEYLAKLYLVQAGVVKPSDE